PVRGRRPCAPPVLSAPVDISFVYSWLHPLRLWSLQESRGGSLNEDGRIWWGKSGNNIPRVKRFLTEVKEGMVPNTLWLHGEVGNTQEAKKELLSICDFEDPQSVFITPKPTRLIRRIIEMASDQDSLILDSFAGSGTTGHAVLLANQADGGNRRFILVEMERDVCQNVTAQRLERAVLGFTKHDERGTRSIEGLGGGFRYCRLGAPIFDEEGGISAEVNFSDLAAHIYFAETGNPISIDTVNQHESPLLGIHEGVAIYLLFNGVLGDITIDGGNILTSSTLSMLPEHNGPRVIYGEGSRLGRERMRREGITFKQIPYGIKVN
ncbi:MAG: DNA methyltransferase, partial [Actinomycetota bacterium]